MQGQGFLHVAQVNKFIYFAVAVATDIFDCAAPGWAFIESREWHYRKERIYCPVVGQALEQTKIADVLVCQQRRKVFKFIWNVFRIGIGNHF